MVNQRCTDLVRVKRYGMRHRNTVRLRIDVLQSPLGEIQIVCSNDAVCAVDYGDFDHRMHALLRRRFGAYELTAVGDASGMTTLFERYFAGELDALEYIPVNGGGTAFQERVWAELRRVPPGQTRSYGQLALQVGRTHARAVGHANRLNPIAIVVPCHRIVGANDQLTGYAGGLARKRWLLDHEARHLGRSPMFTDFAGVTMGGH